MSVDLAKWIVDELHQAGYFASLAANEGDDAARGKLETATAEHEARAAFLEGVAEVESLLASMERLLTDPNTPDEMATTQVLMWTRDALAKLDPQSREEGE